MIQIRRASESDASLLADLGRRTFVDTFSPDNPTEDVALYVSQTYGTDRQLAEIRDPRRILAMAWSGDQAVGYFHLLRGSSEPCVLGPEPMELLRIYVDSGWHGKGIAYAMMGEILSIARSEGAKTLWLGVWERNFRAQAFYSKHRFTKVGEHDFRLGTQLQIDWIMARPVSVD